LVHFALAFTMVVGASILIFSGCFLLQEHNDLARQNVQNAPEYNPQAMTDWKRQVIRPSDAPFTLLHGQGYLRIERWAAENRSLVVEAETPVRIRIRLLDYPGWGVFDNGVALSHGVDPASGAMLLDVSPGPPEEIAFELLLGEPALILSFGPESYYSACHSLACSERDEKPARWFHLRPSSKQWRLQVPGSRLAPVGGSFRL
jgi:hypothetical protein